MGVYLISGCCMKQLGTKQILHHSAVVKRAETAQEARKLGYVNLQERYPYCEGWDHFDVEALNQST